MDEWNYLVFKIWTPLMFSIEIRINGELVTHIKGRHKCTAGQDSVYDYSIYNIEKEEMKTGTVLHTRRNGIQKLVCIILEDTEDKNG